MDGRDAKRNVDDMLGVGGSPIKYCCNFRVSVAEGLLILGIVMTGLVPADIDLGKYKT
jgi:hypothetical protein